LTSRLALAALVACGDAASPAIDAAVPDAAGAPDASVADAPPAPACTLTLTGAVAGTFPCAPPVFAHREDEGVTVIGLGGSYAGEPVDAISVVARLVGVPEARELTEDDFETLVFTVRAGAETFTASGGDGPSVGLIGRLTFTSVEGGAAHGSWNAVLIGAGGHGTVALSASF
jgi:hypothetical protein